MIIIYDYNYNISQISYSTQYATSDQLAQKQCTALAAADLMETSLTIYSLKSSYKWQPEALHHKNHYYYPARRLVLDTPSIPMLTYVNFNECFS